jgi:glycosyltransferase involved in cell wall biosynthesis
MYEGKRVSLILPTYNERDSIREVIESFERTGVVDEIIVVNNNAAPGTSEEVARTSAIEVHEPLQGYGSAIRRGFQEATGDLIVVCEPDATFVAADIFKLLAYSNDVGVVYGTRTVRDFIWEGANMGALLRYGNWATAKLMEVLYNTNSLSDVGCTFRLIRREHLERLRPLFRVTSNSFGLEMMILSHRCGIPSVQIPLGYRRRVGRSSVTGTLGPAIKLGIQMVILLVGMRFGIEVRDLAILR